MTSPLLLDWVGRFHVFVNTLTSVAMVIFLIPNVTPQDFLWFFNIAFMWTAQEPKDLKANIREEISIITTDTSWY